MQHAMSVSGNAKDAIKFTEVLIKDIVIGGDKTMIDDDDCFFAISEAIEPVLEKKTAELKKL
jgi:hypothetical protein